jgi:heme exporter protein D
MNEFLDMGGYGGYVWPAYGIAALLLSLLALATWRRGSQLRKKLQRRFR